MTVWCPELDAACTECASARWCHERAEHGGDIFELREAMERLEQRERERKANEGGEGA